MIPKRLAFNLTRDDRIEKSRPQKTPTKDFVTHCYSACYKILQHLSEYFGIIMTSRILVLNGPNLNLLGTREPGVYGHQTLADIEARCREKSKTLGFEVEFRQTNAEGQLLDWIQQARQCAALIIINAGAYTHTSIALLDALLSCGLPVIEVHLSNIHQREDFRHKSYVSKAARGMICGFGGFGYEMALDAAKKILD
mgnify:CR=1 FL=1